MPHRHAGSSNVGLTTALGVWFDAYYSARRRGDGKVCEGEELCRVAGTPHKKGGLRDMKKSGQAAENICSACDLFPTKPGNIPNHLAHLVSASHRMEALFESHAGSSYPVEFTPLEWEAFLALKYARAKDEESRMPKPVDKKQQSEEQRLRLRLARG